MNGGEGHMGDTVHEDLYLYYLAIILAEMDNAPGDGVT